MTCVFCKINSPIYIPFGNVAVCPRCAAATEIRKLVTIGAASYVGADEIPVTDYNVIDDDFLEIPDSGYDVQDHPDADVSDMTDDQIDRFFGTENPVFADHASGYTIATDDYVKDHPECIAMCFTHPDGRRLFDVYPDKYFLSDCLDNYDDIDDATMFTVKIDEQIPDGYQLFRMYD